MHVRFKLSIKIEKDLRNNIFFFISLHVMTQGIDKRWQGVYIHVSVKFWLFYKNGGKSTEVNLTFISVEESAVPSWFLKVHY